MNCLIILFILMDILPFEIFFLIFEKLSIYNIVVISRQINKYFNDLISCLFKFMDVKM